MKHRETSSRKGRSWGLGLVLGSFLGVAVGWALFSPRESASPSSTLASASEALASTWTCSMHPQIQLPKPGACPLCGMDLIPLAASEEEADVALDTVRLSKAAQALARIETQSPARRPLVREVELFGALVRDPNRVQVVASRVPGRLDRLFVQSLGTPVAVGDHLVQIYSPELFAAQEELLQALRTQRKSQGLSSFLENSSRATLKASREKLRLWGLEDPQIRSIERRGEATEHLTVSAKVRGSVLEIHAREGSYVREGSPIYTLADLSKLWVHLEAFEKDLAWLRIGQAVEVQVEAWPGETFLARIVWMEPELDPQSRTKRIRLHLDNPHGRLSPGMVAQGRVRAEWVAPFRVLGGATRGTWISPMHPEVVRDQPGSCPVCGMELVRAESLGLVDPPWDGPLPLVLPKSAVLWTGPRSLVYLEDPERPGRYQARVVRVGPQSREEVVILEGLKETDRVVVRGAFQIDSALQIRGGASMMTLRSPAQVKTRDLARRKLRVWLEAQVPRLQALQEKLLDGDSDGASEAFRGLFENLASSELPGPKDLDLGWDPGALESALRWGQDAWEIPEQVEALGRAGKVYRGVAAGLSHRIYQDLIQLEGALSGRDADGEAPR